MARLAALVLLVFLCGTSVAWAQVRCGASTQNEWLTNLPTPPGPYADLSADRIHPVTDNLAEAIERLSHASFTPLNPEETAHFGGAAIAEALRPAGEKGTPYLVRAVYPSSQPTLAVSWNGAGLYVFASGLGCVPFKKQPIIVFLDRAPALVDVRASSAL